MDKLKDVNDILEMPKAEQAEIAVLGSILLEGNEVFEKSKGIDVYIDSGVHLKGFSELTEEAKELAKKRFIDEIKNDTLVLVWDTYEEGDH